MMRLLRSVPLILTILETCGLINVACFHLLVPGGCRVCRQSNFLRVTCRSEETQIGGGRSHGKTQLSCRVRDIFNKSLNSSKDVSEVSDTGGHFVSAFNRFLVKHETQRRQQRFLTFFKFLGVCDGFSHLSSNQDQERSGESRF